MFKALYARTIWLIFLSFSAIALCTGLFFFWLPRQEETRLKVENHNAYVAEAAKLPQALKKKKVAAEAIALAEAKWKPFVERRTPSQNTNAGGINVNVNPYQLLLDTKKFRDSVQIALNRQLKVGGVTVVSGPAIPGVTDQDAPNSVLASYYNYPTSPFPVVIYDLGQVTVQGTYEQIMENVRSWADIENYLAVTQGLALSGTAPRLTGTYNLSLVGYIRYDGIFGPVPDGAGAPAAGGGAGAPPGIPGGRAPSGGAPVPGGRG